MSRGNVGPGIDSTHKIEEEIDATLTYFPSNLGCGNRSLESSEARSMVNHAETAR